MSGNRVFLTVLDACGIGAMPDAGAFGDPPGANTIGNVAQACGGLNLPNLAQLGLCQLLPVTGTDAVEQTVGSFARVTLKSPGKDTTTGHWEIGGIVLDKAFDVFPGGFPDHIVTQFVDRTGCGSVLANKPASGTAVIDEFREQHEASGHPIVYTSADSVFQIAADVDIVPLERLYQWCETARSILNECANVGRVIARPYQIVDGQPTRLGGKRRDYAVPPPKRTLLNDIQDAGGEVFAVGKIEDIFLGQGISFSRHTSGNGEGIVATLNAVDGQFQSDAGDTHQVDGTKPQLVFTNLVDTDALYGHRNNPEGFGRALTEVDAFVGAAMAAVRDGDLLIFVADHGCDPTVPGTDHTREFVPLLMFSKSMAPKDLGVLDSLTSVADIVTDWLKICTAAKINDPQSSAA